MEIYPEHQSREQLESLLTSIVKYYNITKNMLDDYSKHKSPAAEKIIKGLQRDLKMITFIINDSTVRIEKKED